MRKKSIEKFFKKTFIATMAMMLTLGSPMTSLMAMAEECNDSDGEAFRNESSDEHQEEAKEHSETASKSAEESKSSVSAAKDHVGSDNSQSSTADSTDEKTEKSCADEADKAAEAVADKKIEAEGKASDFKADSDTYDQSEVSANSTVVEGTQDVAEYAGEAAKDAVKAADDTISAANDATDDLKKAVEEACTAETEAKQAADKAAEEAGKAAAKMDTILSNVMEAEDNLKTEVSDYNKTVSKDESSIRDYAEKIDVQTTEGEDGSLECQIVIKTTDEEGKEVKKDIIEVTGKTVQNAVDANANVQSDMKELLKKNSWDEECDEILKRMETERDAAGEAKAAAEDIYNSSVNALKDTIDAYNEYARKYGLSTIKMDEKTFELSFDDELTQASEMLTEEERINAAQAGFDKYSTEVESIMAAVNSAEKALEEAENAYKTAAEAVSEASALISIANKNYQIANSQYASADNTYSWAESLNKKHQANAYVQYDENAGDIVDNHYGYDLDTITSNTSKNFQKISNGEFDVPYTLYRDLVAELYENNSFAATKNDDFIGVGSHSELYLKGLTQKQGTLKPYYWEIGNDGKLTGTYFTDKNDMETGRYFLGYSFKIEASDGIHLDGYYYDYVKPTVPQGEKPEEKEEKKTEGKSEDSKKQSSNKNTNTTNTVIDDEATPLAVLSTDSMSVIDDAPVPLASSVSIIDEEPVALESVLKTGDTTIPLIPLAAVGTVMIGTAYLISTLKRRPRK